MDTFVDLSTLFSDNPLASESTDWQTALLDKLLLSGMSKKAGANKDFAQLAKGAKATDTALGGSTADTLLALSKVLSR